MHRVELKVTVWDKGSGIYWLFLMHRVELKEKHVKFLLCEKNGS